MWQGRHYSVWCKEHETLHLLQQTRSVKSNDNMSIFMKSEIFIVLQ